MIIASILPALENVLIKNRSVLFLPNVYIFFNYIHQRLSMQMTLNIVGLYNKWRNVVSRIKTIFISNIRYLVFLSFTTFKIDVFKIRKTIFEYINFHIIFQIISFYIIVSLKQCTYFKR